MERTNLATGAKWESIVGYSRAVKIGNQIEVSGTTSIKDGEVYGETAYDQTKHILFIISDAIEKLGGKMENVVRTRIFTTNIALWEEIGRAHGEVFQNIRPATTMVEVSALIDLKMLVEIEAIAVV